MHICQRRQTCALILPASAQHVRAAPIKVGLDVPEEVEGQLVGLMQGGDIIQLPGAPQLVGEGSSQIILANVLLHAVQPVQEVGLVGQVGDGAPLRSALGQRF